MATAPLLLRRVLVSALPDPDWAAAQTLPADAIMADVAGVSRMGCVCIGYTALNVVAPSTVAVQLVDVATTLEREGVADVTVVKSGEPDVDVPGGSGLVYDVAGSTSVTLRVLAAAGAGVTRIDIYWTSLD